MSKHYSSNRARRSPGVGIRAGIAALGLAAAHAAPAATVTVDTFADAFKDGSGCSLREAVQSVNLGAAIDGCGSTTGGTFGTGDRIELPAGDPRAGETYTLSLTGDEAAAAASAVNDLDVERGVVIAGVAGGGPADPERVVIEPASDAFAGADGRAFQVEAGVDTTALRHLTIRSFRTLSGSEGGAIRQGSALALTEVILAGNAADGGGGAIFQGGGALSVERSAFVRNRSAHADGGGALYQAQNSAAIRNTGFVRNHAPAGPGGAIHLDPGSSPADATTLDNVTIASNSGHPSGGGLRAASTARLAVRNTIIADNRVVRAAGGPDCVIDGNADVRPATDYNLIADSTQCGPLVGPDSIADTGAQLAARGRYSRATVPFRPPLAASPAIDAGSCNDTAGNPIGADQRADARPSGSTCDIGAIERRSSAVVVDTTADTVDATPGDGTCADADGACSLRAAIDEANARTGLDEIVVPAGTYTISRPTPGEDDNASGDLDIRDSAIIHGAGAGATILDGGGLDRVLHVPDLGGSPRTLALSALTVRDGDTSTMTSSGGEAGGGILVEADSLSEFNELRARRVRVTGNHTEGANGSGGGISVAHSDTHLLHSTLDANTAEDSGSAITVSGSSEAYLANLTIAGNGTGSGPALNVSAAGAVSLHRGTIAGNAGAALGGSSGIEVYASIVTSSGAVDCDFFTGPGATSLGYNIVDDSSCGFTATGDQQVASPDLRPLEDIGGGVPLREPKARNLPDAASPAIEGAEPEGSGGQCSDADGLILATFGGTRPQDAPAGTSSSGDGSYDCDVGAAERQQVRLRPVFLSQPASRTVAAGSTGVEMTQVKIENKGFQTIAADSPTLTFRASGSGDDAADVTAVRLYEDDDGTLDAGDTQQGLTATYDADDGTVTFDFGDTPGTFQDLSSGASRSYLLVYELDTRLADGAPVRVDGRAALAGLSGGAGALALLAGVFGTAAVRRRRALWLAPVIASVIAIAACSGGGGNAQTETFTATLEDATMGLTNGRTLDIRTPPVEGATVTVEE